MLWPIFLGNYEKQLGKKCNPYRGTTLNCIWSFFSLSLQQQKFRSYSIAIRGNGLKRRTLCCSINSVGPLIGQCRQGQSNMQTIPIPWCFFAPRQRQKHKISREISLSQKKTWYISRGIDDKKCSPHSIFKSMDWLSHKKANNMTSWMCYFLNYLVIFHYFKI